MRPELSAGRIRPVLQFSPRAVPATGNIRLVHGLNLVEQEPRLLPLRRTPSGGRCSAAPTRQRNDVVPCSEVQRDAAKARKTPAECRADARRGGSMAQRTHTDTPAEARRRVKGLIREGPARSWLSISLLRRPVRDVGPDTLVSIAPISYCNRSQRSADFACRCPRNVLIHISRGLLLRPMQPGSARSRR